MAGELQLIKDRFRGFLPVVVDCETGGFISATDGDGLYDTTSWKSGCASKISLRAAIGSMRRVSVSGWMTTVVLARASTSSSR